MLGKSAEAREIFLAAQPLTQSHDDTHVDVLLGIAMAERQLGNFAAARGQLGSAEAPARREHFEVKLGRVLEEGVRLEIAAQDTASHSTGHSVM